MTLTTEILEDLSFDKTIEYVRENEDVQPSVDRVLGGDICCSLLGKPWLISFCHVMDLLDCSNTGEHVLNHICLVHGHAINPFDLTFDQPRALFIQADKGSLTELFHCWDMLS